MGEELGAALFSLCRPDAADGSSMHQSALIRSEVCSRQMLCRTVVPQNQVARFTAYENRASERRIESGCRHCNVIDIVHRGVAHELVVTSM